MAKVVYNSCYGGFGLSSEAIHLYSKLANLELRQETYPGSMSKTIISLFDENGEEILIDKIKRTDPCLVEVVERLGDKANSYTSNLEIREIPDGSRYRIREYDGLETVITPEEQEWNVA